MGKLQSHGKKKQKKAPIVICNFFLLSRFAQKITLNCHLRNKSNISDERARNVRIFFLAKKYCFRPTLKIRHHVKNLALFLLNFWMVKT